MKPGRELDILVGRHVMGDKGLGVLVPEYSTNPMSASRVLDKTGLILREDATPLEVCLAALEHTGIEAPA